MKVRVAIISSLTVTFRLLRRYGVFTESSASGFRSSYNTNSAESEIKSFQEVDLVPQSCETGVKT